MAGAFGALGADMSSLSVNPAGIAFFRKSEFSVTPGFRGTSAKAHFRGNTSKDDRNELSMGQFGLSFIELSDRRDWESFHFGISYDRKRSFRQRVAIEASDAERSILDHFVRQSNGIHLDDLPYMAPFSGELAYQAYLMDPLYNDSTNYEHEQKAKTFKQEKSIVRSGSMGEALISFGADRNNELYLGGNLGIPIISFERSIVHKESVGEESDGVNLQYSEDLAVSGYGVNLQLGAIYRPNDWSRFGLSFKSPGILRLEDEWTTIVKSKDKEHLYGETPTAQGEHSYRVRTPYRLTASSAFFVKKRGVLSVDYRYSDPSGGKLMATQENADDGGYEYGAENILVRDRYREMHDLRLGMEWRFSPFFIRGGYRYASSPVRPVNDLETGSTRSFSFGAGRRTGDFFIDVAYQRTTEGELHRPVDPDIGQVARIEHRSWALMVTGGTRF